MTAEAHSDTARQYFDALLRSAILAGRRPPPGGQVGPATWSAINIVANAHPEATAAQITAAYDAFNGEHAKG